MKLTSALLLALIAAGVSDGGEQPARTILRADTNEIHGARQNVVQKKDVAIRLCDVILSLKSPTVEDAPMLARHLTLADPRFLGGRMRTPAEVFPAVRKLVEVGRKAAAPTVDAVTHEQANAQQLPINIAYVLSETVGVQEGLRLVKERIGQSQYTEAQVGVLRTTRDILATKITLLHEQEQSER